MIFGSDTTQITSHSLLFNRISEMIPIVWKRISLSSYYCDECGHMVENWPPQGYCGFCRLPWQGLVIELLHFFYFDLYLIMLRR